MYVITLNYVIIFNYVITINKVNIQGLRKKRFLFIRELYNSGEDLVNNDIQIYNIGHIYTEYINMFILN